MKRCNNCVYLNRGNNYAYCMFFTTPNCPNDDGKPAPAASKQQTVEEIKEQIKEKIVGRGIEFPKPYNSRSYTKKIDYSLYHDMICQRFYIEGYTYTEIADEIGGRATGTSLRNYIMKCEAQFDEERRRKVGAGI